MNVIPAARWWFVALATALTAGSAHGQCNFSVAGMPDFDQRRDTLPGGGGVFCVPTAWTNILAWLANHGYPNAMGGTGSWALQSEYSRVTAVIAELGADMGTNPNGGGTNPGGMVSGFTQYLNDHNVGLPAIIFHYNATGTWAPSPRVLKTFLSAGWLTGLTSGRYDFNPSTLCWERGEGHQLTLIQTHNVCSNSPSLTVRNPWTADSDPRNTQSDFAPQTISVAADTLCFDGQLRRMWRDVNDTDPSTRHYFDGVYVLISFGVLDLAGNQQQYDIHTMSSWAGPPGDIVVNSPSTAPMSFVLADPSYANHAIVTHSGLGSTVIPAKLWRHDPSDGSTTFLMNLPGDVTAAAFDRSGRLYLAMPGMLYQIDFMIDTPVLLAQGNQTFQFVALSYNDTTDQVLGLSVATRQFAILPAVQSPPQVFLLPAGVVLSGEGSIAANPLDGSIWVTSSGSPNIYQVIPPVGPGQVQIGDVISTLSLPNPRGLQFADNGRICFSSGGTVHVFYKGPTGNWMADTMSPFAGLAAAGAFQIPRSRDNYDPAIHNGPAFYDEVNPPVLGSVALDCLADFDGSGTVNVLDIFGFLGTWFAEFGQPAIGGHDADVNNDGVVTVNDIFAYLQAFFAGC